MVAVAVSIEKHICDKCKSRFDPKDAEVLLSKNDQNKENQKLENRILDL